MTGQWQAVSDEDLRPNGYVCVSVEDGIATPHNCFSSLLKLRGLFRFGNDLFSLNNLTDIGGFQAKLAQRLSHFGQDCRDILQGLLALVKKRDPNLPQGIDNIKADSLDWTHALVVQEGKKMMLVFPEGDIVAYYTRGADGNFWRCDENGHLCAHDVAEQGKSKCLKFGRISLADIANQADKFAGRFAMVEGKGLQPCEGTPVLTNVPTVAQAREKMLLDVQKIDKEPVRRIDWRTAQFYECDTFEELACKIGDKYYKMDNDNHCFIQVDPKTGKRATNAECIYLSDIQAWSATSRTEQEEIFAVFNPDMTPRDEKIKRTAEPNLFPIDDRYKDTPVVNTGSVASAVPTQPAPLVASDVPRNTSISGRSNESGLA